MAKQKNGYKRLPGKGSASRGSFAVGGGSSELYLGNGHLLRVNSTGYTENYRRFYFTDIQAVTISLTSRRLIWNIVFAVLGAASLLWLLDVENTAGRVTLAIIASLFGVMFLINTLRGPTCQARIQTRIGVEPLPSLGRLSKARKVINLLAPHIQAVQGELSSGEIPQRFAELGARAVPAARTVSTPGLNSYRGGLHSWLFSVFLVEAAAIAINIFAPGILATLLILCTVPTVAVLTIVALVKQGGSFLADGVRTATWVALVHVVLCLAGAYALMLTVVFRNPKLSNDQAAIFMAVTRLQTTLIHEIYGFMAVFALILGVVGLALLWNSQAAADAATEAPSQP